MKYAGLTWWRNNYGSLLQAYALQTVLRNDFKLDYEILCQFERQNNSYGNLLTNIKKNGALKTAKKLLWKFGFRKIRKRNAEMQRFINENLIISSKNYNEMTISEANAFYDGFFCGSDQIWNPCLPGATSMYRLRFAADDKLKIAYAPSIGVKKMQPNDAKAFKSDLQSFKAISCREQQGTDLINRIMEKEVCQTVLDPTFLVDLEIWKKMSDKALYEGKYIFAYMLRGTKDQRKQIESFARKKNLIIITIPFLDSEKIDIYDFKFGDRKIWDASPKDFLSLIRHSKYVFTDSFHCMVFSCLFHRTFYAFPKIGQAQNARLYELQNMLGIKDRTISFNNPLVAISEKIQWDTVDATIQTMKLKSLAYLQSALSQNGEDT